MDESVKLKPVSRKSFRWKTSQAGQMPPIRFGSVVDDDSDRLRNEIADSYCQWTSHNGRLFVPSGRTELALAPAVYEIHSNPQIGLYFEQIPVKTEGLLRFPDSVTDRVVAEIQRFWESEDTFRKHDLAYKRGIMMYGPAGGGKSSICQLAMADVVQRNGIVVVFTDPHLFVSGLRVFRSIQPDTPIVATMEDLDSIIEAHNESDVLNILDGVNVVDKVLFLACPAPDVKILKADLSWVRADRLVPGDKLIAFDEDTDDPSFRTAVVRSCPIVQRPRYRVIHDKGETVVSERHPFLVRGVEGGFQWMAVEDLAPGTQIARICSPWYQEESWEAGYLAGAYDSCAELYFRGKGTQDKPRFRTLWVGPDTTTALDLVGMLALRGFDTEQRAETPYDGPTSVSDRRRRIEISGVWPNLRFLGETRPRRLLSDPGLSDAWEGRRLNSHWTRVIRVEPASYGDVVALDTTTGTFIGDGLLQHNTTNYPDRLGPRIVNRPSRFDKRFRVGCPSAPARKMYLEHLLGDGDLRKGRREAKKQGIDLKAWVRDTVGLSIAHLKELFIAVVILKDTYAEAIETLKSMKEPLDDRDEGQRFGFSVPDDEPSGDGFDMIEWD